MNNLLRLLQLADSGFPTGGFAHSSGLESARLLGVVLNANDVEKYIGDILWQTALQVLPFVNATHQQTMSLQEADQLLDVQITGHVANRASRTQGRTWIQTVSKVFDVEAIKAWQNQVRQRELFVHFGPALGASMSALGIDLAATRAFCLFSARRSVLSAAVRLGLMGPYQAQCISANTDQLQQNIDDQTFSLTPDEACQPSPLVELWGNTHDQFPSKLFLS